MPVIHQPTPHHALKADLNPKTYLRLIRNQLNERRLSRQPNLRGAVIYPPGHFYSPLLDIRGVAGGEANVPFDGADYWEQIHLRPAEQRAYFEELLDKFPFLSFPQQKTPDYRFYTDNPWFPTSDAFTLSGIVRKEKPRRIIEVGSGFSSAVMLDTLEHAGRSAALTFVEPFPERLYSLLSSSDQHSSKILVQPVQEVPLAVFEELEAQDILFVDSSHVAKIGSDVTFLLLRILPRLKPGVFIHFHDIFYPHSYPVDWLREGRAWNESIFLRAFLVSNRDFEIVAFNSYAGHCFPEIFKGRLDGFMPNSGGSIWLRKIG
jgi:predicted O-methyltransferase YrrM